jgi:transcriptional regulator with XRE-family HTH domain
MPSEVLGRQVKRWRTRRRLSAQDLANRATDIGATTLTRVAISKIEVAQRGVSLDEWLQLAHALAVPPPLLFLDLESGDDVQVAPAAVLHPWLVWEWVAGEIPPPMTDHSVARAAEFGDAKHVIHLYRYERAAADAVSRAEFDIRQAEYADDAAALREARTRHADALKELARCLDDMTNNGVQAPGMPPDWVDAMRQLQLLKHPDKITVFRHRSEPDAG